MDDPQALTGDDQGVARAQLRRSARGLPAVLQGRDACQDSPVDLGRGDRLLQQGAGRPARPSAAEGAQAARRQRRARRQGQALRRDLRARPSAASGCRSRHSASTCRRPSSRPRTSASISTRASTSAALIRAFIGNLAQPGRPQGGSTITQQVAKNLLVGDDVTYERKMREMIVASRLEQALSASRRSSSSISTRSISAAAPGASRWRRAAISASRRRR